MLLGYKYLIFTCIKENILIFKDEISQHLSNITKFPTNWEIAQTNLNFMDIYYPEPPDGGSHFMNFIIWEPLNKQGTTVFYINYQDGWNSLIENYAKKFNKTCVQVGMSDENTNFPMFKFKYYEGTKQRVILSYEDYKKWVFFQKGEKLPFEEDVFYNKRRIKDRLPNSLITEYLKKMGWDIVDPNFWKTDKPVYNFKRTQWDK